MSVNPASTHDFLQKATDALETGSLLWAHQKQDAALPFLSQGLEFTLQALALHHRLPKTKGTSLQLLTELTPHLKKPFLKGSLLYQQLKKFIELPETLFVADSGVDTLWHFLDDTHRQTRRSWSLSFRELFSFKNLKTQKNRIFFGCFVGGALLLLGAFQILSPEAVQLGSGKIYWKDSSERAFTEALSLSFQSYIDSQFHTYLIDLPHPIQIQQFRLDPSSAEIDEMMIDSIEFSLNHQEVTHLNFQKEEAVRWHGARDLKPVFFLGRSFILEFYEKYPERKNLLDPLKERFFWEKSELQLQLRLQNLVLSPEEEQFLLEQSEHYAFFPPATDPFLTSPPLAPITMDKVQLRMRLKKRLGFFQWLITPSL